MAISPKKKRSSFCIRYKPDEGQCARVRTPSNQERGERHIGTPQQQKKQHQQQQPQPRKLDCEQEKTRYSSGNHIRKGGWERQIGTPNRKLEGRGERATEPNQSNGTPIRSAASKPSRPDKQQNDRDTEQTGRAVEQIVRDVERTGRDVVEQTSFDEEQTQYERQQDSYDEEQMQYDVEQTSYAGKEKQNDGEFQTPDQSISEQQPKRALQYVEQPEKQRCGEELSRRAEASKHVNEGSKRSIEKTIREFEETKRFVNGQNQHADLLSPISPMSPQVVATSGNGRRSEQPVRKRRGCFDDSSEQFAHHAKRSKLAADPEETSYTKKQQTQHITRATVAVSSSQPPKLTSRSELKATTIWRRTPMESSWNFANHMKPIETAPELPKNTSSDNEKRQELPSLTEKTNSPPKNGSARRSVAGVLNRPSQFKQCDGDDVDDDDDDNPSDDSSSSSAQRMYNAKIDELLCGSEEASSDEKPVPSKAEQTGALSPELTDDDSPEDDADHSSP